MSQLGTIKSIESPMSVWSSSEGDTQRDIIPLTISDLRRVS